MYVNQKHLHFIRNKEARVSKDDDFDFAMAPSNLTTEPFNFNFTESSTYSAKASNADNESFSIVGIPDQDHIKAPEQNSSGSRNIEIETLDDSEEEFKYTMSSMASEAEKGQPSIFEFMELPDVEAHEPKKYMTAADFDKRVC